MTVGETGRLSFERSFMATTFELILDEGERHERDLPDLELDVFDQVRQVEELLSAYIPSSDVCWINENAAERAVPVHPDTFDLLELSQRLHRETDGAFDITVGPLVRCWGFFRREGAVPDQADLERALECVGMQHIELDRARRTVRFLRPGVEVNLGGIGKGFALAVAARRLRQWGVQSALIHAGRSTFYAIGQPARLEGWRIGLREGLTEDAPRIGWVSLRDQAFSTSGADVQFFVADGKKYGHIIDPRTGWPVQGMRSAAAVSPDPTLADALSTAFFVGGANVARRYCAGKDEGAIIIREGQSGEVEIDEINCALSREET